MIDTTSEVVCGRRQPELGGFRFVSPEEPTASCDVTLSGGAGAAKAFALLLDPDSAHHHVELEWTEVVGEIDFSISGLTESNLRVRAGENSLTIGD